MLAFWDDFRTTVEKMFDPLSDSDGDSEEDVLTAEKRLGITLPPLLREYYLTLGQRSDINESHDRLLLLEELHLVKTKLVFYEESQSVCVWALDLRESDTDDPAVWRKFSVSEESNEAWELDHSRLSGFFLAMLFWQAVNGGMPYTGIGVANSDRIVDAEGWELRAFADDLRNVLLRPGQVLYICGNDINPEVYAGGKTVEEFLSLEKVFGAVWNYSTLDNEEPGAIEPVVIAMS